MPPCQPPTPRQIIKPHPAAQGRIIRAAQLLLEWLMGWTPQIPPNNPWPLRSSTPNLKMAIFSPNTQKYIFKGDYYKMSFCLDMLGVIWPTLSLLSSLCHLGLFHCENNYFKYIYCCFRGRQVSIPFAMLNWDCLEISTNPIVNSLCLWGLEYKSTRPVGVGWGEIARPAGQS